jgi:hypothetical protein
MTLEQEPSSNIKEQSKQQEERPQDGARAKREQSTPEPTKQAAKK